MTTAREILHAGAACIQENETLQDAARRMRELDVGALPICGEDDRLHRIITDRDIVVKCLARGKDPRTVTAGRLKQGKPITIEAQADANQALQARGIPFRVGSWVGVHAGPHIPTLRPSTGYPKGRPGHPSERVVPFTRSARRPPGSGSGVSGCARPVPAAGRGGWCGGGRR
ncbi:hypothetical protein GCM10010307_25280 [Streptomyces vastus]|uniref:CBS domain-containing protein n=2 Tax=Streptomyces vastus TaxID=285451 RepID=A0ABP6D4T0_9ACTN